MNTPRPSRNGYTYRKSPRHPDTDAAVRDRARRLSLAWRVRPIYEQAGSPFGDTERGLWLWVEFGRRTHSN